MTAVNVVLYPDRVAVFTDTKATTECGIQYNVQKAAALPWMRTVVAVRGYVGALRVFERLISQNATNYDQALQFIAENWEAILAADYADASEAFAVKQDLDLHVAGWSAAGPAAFWISNYQTDGQVRRIGHCHISPMVDLEAQKRFAADVRRNMPALMADQARQHVGVGGWIVAHEVHDDGISSYPIGGISGLSAVASMMQPAEEVAALAAVEAANAERAARLAARAAP